jgi:outer membrane cobalamin receptor
MGFARSLSVPCLVISWLSVATVNVAAQQELSGTVVDESGSALPRVAVTLVDQRDVEIATTPTILQSFSPSPSFLGNPDLEPERATTVDAGIEQRLLAQRLKSDFSSLVPPIVENAGYQTWDAGASYRVAAPATRYLRVDNLGDRDYMDPLGYPAWRRTARAGARVSW